MWGWIVFGAAILGGAGYVGFQAGYSSGLMDAPAHYDYESERAAVREARRVDDENQLARLYPWADTCDRIVDLIRDELQGEDQRPDSSIDFR